MIKWFKKWFSHTPEREPERERYAEAVDAICASLMDPVECRKWRVEGMCGKRIERGSLSVRVSDGSMWEGSDCWGLTPAQNARLAKAAQWAGSQIEYDREVESTRKVVAALSKESQA